MAQRGTRATRRPGLTYGELGLWLAPLLALAALAACARRIPRVDPAPGQSLSRASTISPERLAAAEPGRGRMARSPGEIPARGWQDVLWRTWRETSEDRLTVVAGGVTFYGLLAIFPAAGVVVSLYGLIADVHEVPGQLAVLAGFVPPQALAILGEQMTRLAERQESTLSLAFAVSLLISLWSANAGMKALFNGLNIAYDEVERRSFLALNLTTFAFTAGALAFLTAAAVVMAATPAALHAVGWDAATRLWPPLRWAALLAVAAGGLAVVYRYGPSRERARWRWVSWGGVIASAAWLAASLGFSWYVSHAAHLDVAYGSLGTVIAFMMWIWTSVMVVLVGAELNAEIEHQTTIDSTTGAPLPLGEPGAAMADSVGLPLKISPAEAVVGLWRRVTRPGGSRTAANIETKIKSS